MSTYHNTPVSSPGCSRARPPRSLLDPAEIQHLALPSSILRLCGKGDDQPASAALARRNPSAEDPSFETEGRQAAKTLAGSGTRGRGRGLGGQLSFLKSWVPAQHALCLALCSFWAFTRTTALSSEHLVLWFCLWRSLLCSKALPGPCSRALSTTHLTLSPGFLPVCSHLPALLAPEAEVCSALIRTAVGHLAGSWCQ